MIDSHVSLSVRVVRETRLPANTVFKAAKHDRGILCVFQRKAATDSKGRRAGFQLKAATAEVV